MQTQDNNKCQPSMKMFLCNSGFWEEEHTTATMTVITDQHAK